MKKPILRLLSIFLCVLLLVSSLGVTIYALTTNKNEPDPKETTSNNPTNDNDNDEITKDETVYVIAGSNGSVKKIIVSDWIKNALNKDKLNDKSALKNVENVKGNETYSMNGDNMRVWDAQGKDIYYQGNIEKELPVDLSVTYKLDGKEISPEKLAGKSGHVTIRFDYKNNQYETVNIDGKDEKIYVPFAMLTGIMLDNNVFTNVNVSNGKLINDGDRTAVVGIAFPGLQNNLDLDSSKFDIPEFVEISADVKNFEFSTTITIASNEVFNEFGTDKLDSIDDLSKSTNELTKAMNQLMDGSSQLYNGLCTLLDKSGELIDGINKLAAGAQQLKDGSANLNNGAIQLQDGATQLYNGLNKLSSNNANLNGGAKQVFKSLLSMANNQLSAAGLSVPTLTIENYSSVLNNIIDSLDETKVYQQALEQVTAAVNAKKDLIQQKVTLVVREEVTAKVTKKVEDGVLQTVTQQVKANEQQFKAAVLKQALNMTIEEYNAAVNAGAITKEQQDSINAAVETAMNKKIEEQMKSDEILSKIKSMIETNVAEQMESDTIKELIEKNTKLQIEKAISENMASEEVQSKLQAASKGAQAVITLKSSLDSYNSFYIGLLTYTSGVADATTGAGKLKQGTDTLKAGTSKLSEGINELCNGIFTLKNGAPELINGITQLKDGSMKLSKGLKDFNEKGIKKIVNAVNGDLDKLVTRIRATSDVSKNYQSFSGVSDDMNGQVKFIYKTESIKKNK